MFDQALPPKDSGLSFDMDIMLALLSDLDDAALSAIEDDLDFYHFSGVASDRLKGLLDIAAMPPAIAA
ncbi:hypothetical protein GQ651_08900 [Alphaproteobacteria bacterium GH1-50]|uniref:Uncharacterized protein n=1 Tax=Kangsaoukella pontilimi TaxID=2691042 RepID=A0A7C9IHV1_9RHOB|nr:hypothetical protein [Kangsaoukella pontilimi]MXQ07962.1 hypothetical protein [Kangsaoukella pontilimi]